MSADESPPPGSAVPPWQRTLVRRLGPAVCGVALNQIADVVPYPAVAVAAAVLAILYGLSRLDRTAPLVRGLPRVLLRVIAAGVVAAMLLPASWTGPVIAGLTGLIVLALLLTRRRGDALAALIGISVFSYGVALVFSATQLRSSIVVTGFLAGCGVLLALVGLGVLSHPEQVIRSNGLSLATLGGLRRWVTDGAGFGVLAALGGLTLLAGLGVLTTDGRVAVRVAAAVLLVVAGLAVIGAEVVLWLPERHGPFFGVLLALAGLALTALGGLIGFAGAGPDLVAVPILGTFGLALAGGGLSLLDDAGSLRRWQRRLRCLVRPDPDARAAGGRSISPGE
ncbi:hypothetical protein GCM10020358_24800 [Amorphoplanes nipponensis]|uniref:Uncharacterized protein n=1 Tax=Actinoplanes nipponensis TaxID=135950 RepID=A0A919JQD9_9ACTN|nr:hypothetical protein [Actinoplanes nipponensis]GIE53415.1 hypothetical protein Ani05nite_69490 [Actinoplanes nipponensis]